MFYIKTSGTLRNEFIFTSFIFLGLCVCGGGGEIMNIFKWENGGYFLRLPKNYGSFKKYRKNIKKKKHDRRCMLNVEGEGDNVNL